MLYPSRYHRQGIVTGFSSATVEAAASSPPPGSHHVRGSLANSCLRDQPCLVVVSCRLRPLKTDRSCQIDVSHPRPMVLLLIQPTGSLLCPRADPLFGQESSFFNPSMTVLLASTTPTPFGLEVVPWTFSIVSSHPLLLVVGFMVLGKDFNCPNYLCVWWTSLMCSLKLVLLVGA